MPENKWLEFENFKFNLPVPYTIYADFESLIVKINSCAPDPERSSTVPIANHIPCGYAFSSANNKYLDSYDENKPSKYILYLDANNLYGWAMSQPLPTHGFEWITQPIDFMEIPDESDIGYILEVDMDYPQNLHNLHNDYPPGPRNIKCDK
ncbi:uncharacterized protein TNCV_1169751 [Trichonephila clavipes]|uniref:DNA-directed DNA polymerase n=1 Tax=Trichonephila clavipes TaxID=2585209 RepID=A0A8X6T721_TRICX|nr:uncharacterized protein TNCV_1169751 [Trichonephila clavipes]